MKRLIFLLIVTFLAAVAASSRATAFVGVNVIPMDRERVLTNQTVVVRNGIISQIGSVRSVARPSDATRIDGKGKFLMPGLVDSHIHLRQANERGLIQSIEHLLGFLDPIMTPNAAYLDKKDLRAVFHAVDFDRSKLPELTRKMRKAGVWNTRRCGISGQPGFWYGTRPTTSRPAFGRM